MRKFLLGLAILTLGATLVYASCDTGTIKCGASCVSSSVSGICPGSPSQGLTFTGMCVGKSTATSCQYIRCSGGNPICVSGPFGAQGCTGDSSCATGQVCISDSGTAGCGDGFSVCATSCYDGTTTTTTAAPTTTTAAPTTTTAAPTTTTT